MVTAMNATNWTNRFRSQLTTTAQLVRYFSQGRRVFMLPLLLLFLISGILLILAGGLSYVAPFVYAII